MNTPTRRHMLKQAAYRREYCSAHRLLQNEMTPDELASDFAHILMVEIKEMYHLDNNSLLRDTHSLLHNFSWEVVWAELEAKAPTLLCFYRHMLCLLLQKHSSIFQFLLILKWRFPGIGLV